MKQTLPFIEQKQKRSGGIPYYDPYDYNEFEILNALNSRSRFKNLSEFIQKIKRIDTKSFTKCFSNRYFIHAECLNDARLAMLALYYTIVGNSEEEIGGYIVSKISNMVMGSGGNPFFDDDENDDESDFDEALRDKSNPTFSMFSPMYGVDTKEENIFFLLAVNDSFNPFYEDETPDYEKIAKEKNMLYIRIEKDSKAELAELFCNIANSADFDTSEVADTMQNLITNDIAFDEYSINLFTSNILSKHLLENPDDKVIHLEDIESSLSSIKKKTTKSADKEPSLVGLKDEREKINSIIDMLKLEKRRADLGLCPITNGCNIVFAGPPGTAKTTLARHFAKSLADTGLIISKDNFKECKKSDLIGKYVGWTASMVDNMFKNIAENGGGVIFFDEIYTLSDSQTDYDKEAITCITQNMENYRGKVYCIFAGYGDKMDEFLSSNPGLRSRIQFNVKFRDYDSETLANIFYSIAESSDFKVSKSCKKDIIDYFVRLKNSRGEQFGNGREARNLFTNTVSQLAARLSALENVTRADLTTIKKADILKAAADILSSELKIQTNSRKIGF